MDPSRLLSSLARWCGCFTCETCTPLTANDGVLDSGGVASGVPVWLLSALQAFGINTKEALLSELQHQLGATPAPAAVA